jgi:hypothetical protein
LKEEDGGEKRYKARLVVKGFAQKKGSNMQDINVLKKKLANSFAMKDLGAAKKILGMRITRDKKNRKLTLSQGEYTEKVLERFRMQNAKPVSTPLASHFKLTKEMCPKTQEEIEYMSRVPYSSAVGSLMYAMVCTRPDIAHAVGVVSRYMNNPGKEHWEAVKWILRYLRGTTTHALCFGGSDTFLQGYVDSDMAGDKDSRRSTTGYVFTIGGTTVSWISKLQKVVALSTTEAEYVAATEASKEMIWLQRFMEELGKKQENNKLYCDSQSAIHLAKNSAFHSKTKHIQLRYHFIRSALEDGQLKLEKIHTSQNPTDMLTKGVTREKLVGKTLGTPGGRRRQWKANKVIKRMVLGSDISLEETCRMALCGLVGRISYNNLCKVSLPVWVEKTWAPILGYVPEILFLTKGWLGFICKSLEDLTLLLDNRWVIGGSSLMLKRWRVAFDPTT